MKSIQIFLIASILATLTLFNFIAALQGYKSSLHEAEKLFDRQLLQTAKLIANLHVDKTTNNLNQLSELAYQVWHNDQLLAASNNAQVETITERHQALDMQTLMAIDGEHWPISTQAITTGLLQRRELIFDIFWPKMLLPKPYYLSYWGFPLWDCLSGLLSAGGLNRLKTFQTS